jgi:hypothetical protein
MSGLGATQLAIVVLALLWLAIAAMVALVAARRYRIAEQVVVAARANARLLEISPARPLVVKPDGRIESDALLLRELGLEGAPGTLDELQGGDRGIAAEDLAMLAGDIAAARASAGKVARKVAVNGSSRVFEVRGGPAPV